ncbi:DUF1850 domain-containing protein [Halomonas sp. MCCC 1A17488]|uniref:DUF1850 domain-containing protein n=2 Tax=Oceanospirillales TaxID=135619 RepID=A0ABX7WAP9_9GAMM|nr:MULTISPECIES: DUF1850 domain-containing protein [Halomonas]MCE8017665.1 DUF1850 domain-containing protein [Halomonas sp. MCCC 1A17488]MCG3240998.1 DUF1850 domain-containing protein [Halomonas sp. MCCC 1A17488]QPP51683.1 DUF1850 domain-containing protein [Halomonas sp. SS10-MC5]QTP57170.1 DUF1850 domain-containing protein [Halomonas sulfidoxydans]
MPALPSCCRPYNGRRYRLLAAAIVGWLGLVAVTAKAEDGASLAVLDAAGDTLVEVPLEPGMRWCLGWNHSVKKFPVLDCYRYHQGRMVLERSHQPDFAAGLGHTLGRGEQVSDGEGGYWIENIDEPVPGDRYVLRVGSPSVDHRLLWQDDGGEYRISLSGLAAGERVTLQLNKPEATGKPDDV